jgi:hypothetical protein
LAAAERSKSVFTQPRIYGQYKYYWQVWNRIY